MDFQGRDKAERKLARALGKLQQNQLMRLLEYLGDPPDINAVPESFWDEVGRELLEVLRPALRDNFLASAQQFLEAQPIGVEWGLINEAAVVWARDYSFDLVKGINATSRRALQQHVGRFFEEQLTLGELTGGLQSLYGPVRAELIATTEVTRAAVQGELAMVSELRAMGVEMVAVWQTNQDEIVMQCAICWPRQGKRQGDGWTEPPPAHPRCRCWLNHEVVMPEGA